MKPTVYLAARYARLHEMQHCADELRDLGFDVCSSWHESEADPHDETTDPLDLQHAAQTCLYDIGTADMLILFTEPAGQIDGATRGGRHVEMGIALGYHLHVLTVGPPESAFCYLPLVTNYPTFMGLLTDLEGFPDD